MTLIRRAFAPDLEVGADGRTIVGIACPFDTPAQITEPGGSYTEVFRRGAFTRTIAERGPGRVKVYAQHQDRALPLGRAEILREDTAGLYAELRVSKTAAGDEVLELVRDGVLDGLSIGAVPIRADRSRPGHVERLEVSLREVSVVGTPAYDTARVLAVRSETHPTYINLARLAQRRAELLRLEL